MRLRRAITFGHWVSWGVALPPETSSPEMVFDDWLLVALAEQRRDQRLDGRRIPIAWQTQALSPTDSAPAGAAELLLPRVPLAD